MHQHNYNQPNRRLGRACISFCPAHVVAYSTLHLDSLPKIVNHFLVAMLIADGFLFFTSWNVSLLPSFGFMTVLISFFLIVQSICVLLILNNNRISALSFLAPTDFMIGIAVGISIGGTILAFVLSKVFRNMSKCHDKIHTKQVSEDDPLYQYICDRSGSLTAIWFWSGLIFWLNFCCSMLLAVGRQELAQPTQYERVDMTMDDYEHALRQQQAASQGSPHDLSFVGDYATIPEIRSGHDGSPAKRELSGEDAAMVTSI